MDFAVCHSAFALCRPMPAKRNPSPKDASSSATIGFEAKLWLAADTAQEEQLTPAQDEWLEWARTISQDLSPFDCGYPDPARDGACDPDSIPFGGPYPAKRDFPRPPTMPKIPPPVVQSGYGNSGHYHPYR